ncbi:MAG: thioredoxin family protein [Sphingobacteriia bacterium]|nr:thioredoxin family protein [Sphingobacteriia bacterium]
MIKFRFILLLLIVSVAGCSHKLQYQSYYNNRNEKVLKGFVNRSVIEKDTSYKWFDENMKWGKLNEQAVETFRTKKNDFTMVVFAGTWCEDTQTLLPVFYRLVAESGYSEKNITLYCVDRDKQTTKELAQKFNPTHTPTFIVLHNNKEIGRVTEYGKYGAIDKELGEIVAAIK